MARAIVRYSFRTEDKAHRQQIRDVLEGAGFEKIGDAAYERQGSASAAIDALTSVLSVAKDATLGHVWIYLDESDGR
jgi:hypothetical protein